MPRTLQEALTEAKQIADTLGRQVWICECGGLLECLMNPCKGSHLVARSFGSAGFQVDDPKYVDVTD